MRQRWAVILGVIACLLPLAPSPAQADHTPLNDGLKWENAAGADFNLEIAWTQGYVAQGAAFQQRVRDVVARDPSCFANSCSTTSYARWYLHQAQPYFGGAESPVANFNPANPDPTVACGALGSVSFHWLAPSRAGRLAEAYRCPYDASDPTRVFSSQVVVNPSPPAPGTLDTAAVKCAPGPYVWFTAGPADANNDAPACRTYDLMSVLAHEVGHVLGFGEYRLDASGANSVDPVCLNGSETEDPRLGNNTNRETMCIPIFSGSERQRTPEEHEKDAFSKLYPPTGPAPTITPATQTATSPDVTWNVSVPKDPARATSFYMIYGDGTYDTRAVPQGSGSASFVITHPFPPGTGTYMQRATIVETGAAATSTTQAVTASAGTAIAVDDPNPEIEGRWGERLAAANYDYNGDGKNDVFTSKPHGGAAAGKVHLLSGASLTARGRPTVIWSATSPAAQASSRFGFAISVIGDVNGDAKPDLAVGTDAQDVGANVDQGKFWVLNGATGAALYGVDNPAPQAFARFGSRLGAAGDTNGDGTPDIIAGASSNDLPAGCGNASPVPSGCRKDQGQAYVFSGVNGTLIAPLNLPLSDYIPPSGTTCVATGTATEAASSCGSFGLSVQGVGDTNGNGVRDLVVSAPGWNGAIGRMYLFEGNAVVSAANPVANSLIMSIDNPVPHPMAFFGFQDVTPLAPGDVNGNGLADIYGGGWLQDGPAGPAQGQPWIFDGQPIAGTTHNKAPLYALPDPHPKAGGQFGWSATSTVYTGPSDTPGFGPYTNQPALYVGSSPHFLSAVDQNGDTNLFRTDNGLHMRNLPLPSAYQQGTVSGHQALGPNLGWTVAAPGDLNGDGKVEYLSGIPFWDSTTKRNEGAILAYVSPNYGPAYCPALPDGSPTGLC